MATAELPLRDIVHTRVLLETWAVRHADREAPAMEELVRIMDAMDQDELSLKDYHQLDVSFHVALTRLSGNSLLTGLLTSMRDAVYEYEMSLVGYVPLWSATATRLRAEHRAIYAALEAGNNDLAARMVAEHIEGHYLEAGVDPDRQEREGASVFDAAGAEQDPETGEMASVSELSPRAAEGPSADRDHPEGHVRELWDQERQA